MQRYPLDWHPWVQLFNVCEIHASRGNLAEAESIATEQYQNALTERSVEAQAWFAWQLTRILGQRGHVGRGTRYGREAVALFTQLGRPQFVAYALAHGAPVVAASGEAGRVCDAVAELESVADEFAAMGADLLAAEAASDAVVCWQRRGDAQRSSRAGRTPKDIAAELHLSARTVSNHLQRVYAKLGVNGRAELAEVLEIDR